MPTLLEQVEDIEEKFYQEIEALALQQFNQYIRPYFQQEEIYFVSGNGAWYISKWENILDDSGQCLRRIEVDIDTEDLPKEIQNILTTQVMGKSFLGEFIPKYDPTIDKGITSHDYP